MCKGTDLPLTCRVHVCNDGRGQWENIYHNDEWSKLSSLVTNPSSKTGANARNLAYENVRALLDTLDRGLLVADRQGFILLANTRAQKCLEEHGKSKQKLFNFFTEILHVDPKEFLRRIEEGEHEIKLNGNTGVKPFRAKVKWIPESDWLAVEFANEDQIEQDALGNAQITVQELLQEREITYRNLLAAYLKLQEVNRQKTVFLASAAHELKTPLAVIKGYYDLLLTGSLGRLTEKQKDILEESKESCERLVRLVSMFLNYSALESGKLVLQLRENDLRDCLEEMSSRWSEAFQRKGVKLESHLDPSIPTFRFDYQKVQQAAANLLDNALKHTPAGGSVTLRAKPHFWERRIAEVSPVEERRRFRLPRPNSVEVSVTDSGPGIAHEHHQEIFEDFVRVDRNTSGMGLGLAIAKRLIQAHRGKIWVESEHQRGSTFAFLLPMDQH
jgi:signal transduction histidine kinase